MKKQIILPDYLHLYVGKLATGKTTEIKKHIKKYVSIRKKHRIPYRVLVVDPFDEYSDLGKEISQHKIETFKNSICRIKHLPKSGNPFNFKNGLLVIEQHPLPSYDLYSLVTRIRHANRSIILSFKNINIDYKVFINSDYLTLFNINNSPSEQQHIHNLGMSEIIDVMEECRDEQSRLDKINVMVKYKRYKTIELKHNQIDSFQKVSFDFRNRKVIGVSEEAFFNAVMSLSTNNISINEKKTVAKLLETSKMITHYSKYYGE